MARYDLRLPEEEFWAMVPIAFDALLDRRLCELRDQDQRAGVIAALIANSIPTKKKKRATKPEDLFPRLKRKPGGGE